MKTELYRVIKEIDIKKLDSTDAEELLRFFMVAENDLIRNQLAFILSDLHYNKAVPYIIKKINEESSRHNNGSLVYSLSGFELIAYFIPIIEIICEQEYEPRLMAYQLVSDLSPLISDGIRIEAIKILEEQRIRLERSANDKGENSTLHFVEKTKELLQRVKTFHPC